MVYSKLLMGGGIKMNLENRTYEYLIELEQHRQNDNIELIASENFPSQRVLSACGSILTNKYAEGYPGKRYYGGCQFIDMVETKAINDACKLFNCKYANVQPHCGSSANMATIRALIKPGDTILSMSLDAGGHLSHGHKLSFSGQDYKIVPYGVDNNGILDLEDFTNKLYECKPQLIIVGASSYSRAIPYDRIYEIITEYKTRYYISHNEPPYYMVDMAHIAGLVAGGQHMNPCDWADVVTSTTHKTLRGPRGGLILTNREDVIESINKNVFPGVQGGPLEHIICAKGICFEEAMTNEFKEYAKQIVNNSKAFANKFKELGWKIVSDGTDNHMFVLDTYNSFGITGKEAEEKLDKINITVNKNQIPGDTLPPLQSSGIRIGTPAMTTKGFKEEQFEGVANIIDGYLRWYKEDEITDEQIESYRQMVKNIIESCNK